MVEALLMVPLRTASIQNPVTSEHMSHPVPLGFVAIYAVPYAVFPELFYGTLTPVFF